jgi:molybdenum cofactor cytidylyltransferase
MTSFASIVPVILAAGDSSRMGYPKALLPLGPEVFLTHILGTAQRAGLGKPMVVLGRSASIIQSRIDERRITILINPDPDRGQLSSIQLALSSLQPDCIAAMIWPVDQPLVSLDLIKNLAQLFLSSGCLIACPVCGERHGHPAIFRRDLFREFMEAPLDEGPKKIVFRHRAATAALATDESGTVHDIDTPSDYETVCGENLDSAVRSCYKK